MAPIESSRVGLWLCGPLGPRGLQNLSLFPRPSREQNPLPVLLPGHRSPAFPDLSRFAAVIELGKEGPTAGGLPFHQRQNHGEKGPRASGTLGNGPLTTLCSAPLTRGKTVSSSAVAHREASLSIRVLCSSSISNSFRNGPNIGPPVGGPPAFAPASWQLPVLFSCLPQRRLFFADRRRGVYPAPGLAFPDPEQVTLIHLISRSREGTIGRMAGGVSTHERSSAGVL